MEQRNLTIAGAGKEPGGEYGTITIAGSGKLLGPTVCTSFMAAGSGKVEGDLTVLGPVSIPGAGKIEGALRAERVEVYGALKTEGPMTAASLDLAGSLKTEGNLELSGSARVAGTLKVEGELRLTLLQNHGVTAVEGPLFAVEVENHGKLKVEGEVQAETFRSRGGVNVAGLLNAERVELVLGGENEIGSIGGSVVTVSAEHKGFLFGSGTPHLDVQTVEADEITLENTASETVRGARIHIGANCVIDRVEYMETLTTDPTAQIGQKIKI